MSAPLKPTEVPHDEKPAQSQSSLGEHIESLYDEQKYLRKQLKIAKESINFHKSMMEEYIGSCEEFEMNMRKKAEGEMQMWRATMEAIYVRLNAIDLKLREIYGSPKKRAGKQEELAGDKE